MNNVIKIEFQISSDLQKDLIVAELSELNYYAFEDNAILFSAFINEEDFKQNILNDLSGKLNLKFKKELIEEKNWNEKWESDYQPIVVDDFVAVRAHFHQLISDVKFDIIITPKMSFGTGHHATTFLMIRQLKELAIKGRTVLDFGTGTGILAIIAGKLGGKVLGIDLDDWSINNAQENILLNDCGNIEIRKASEPPPNEKFDIVLANINTNVILNNIISIKSVLNYNGLFLCSGFIFNDVKKITSEFLMAGFVILKSVSKDGWHCLLFKYADQ